MNGTSVECGYGETEKHDVEMSMNRASMEDIINGRMTFQRAFMSGVMQRMKGDFRILRTLDQNVTVVQPGLELSLIYSCQLSEEN